MLPIEQAASEQVRSTTEQVFTMKVIAETAITSELDVDVRGFVETKGAILELEGNKIYRNDRNKDGGGVAIAVNENIA